MIGLADRRSMAVVLGSSRSDGNTRRTVNLVFGDPPVGVVDLSRLDIRPYEYARRDRGDDFRGVMARMLERPLWVLATPVYWYAMSGQMKVFFDRFSELLTERKEDGRLMRGKEVVVIASGTDPALPDGFESPFRQTCDYLGMRYRGAFYLQFDEGRIARATAAREAAEFAANLVRIARSHGRGSAGAGATPPPQVRLEAPSAAREGDFLAAVRRSRRLHGRFVSPPATQLAYRNWLTRSNGTTNVFHFVVEAASGELAGVINLSEIVRGGFHSAYLGYYGLAPWAGRGLMTEGMRQVVARSFGELGLHRVEANIQPDNAASLALVARLGFSREGYSRRYLKINGRWRDHERWALLREDWKPRG
jgi:ribosomal-protein-alanine N-acetyltransferase